jgi:Ca2+-binding RTX toxin-like protein
MKAPFPVFFAVISSQVAFGIFPSHAADIIGTPGPDVLEGTTEADRINGKGGADVMMGLPGHDIYVVGDIDDEVLEAVGDGTDKVKASISYRLPINVENLILVGTATINGTGNGLANKITGNSAKNVLRGLGGDDRLDGGDGNDRLMGGAGTNVLIGDSGRDYYEFDQPPHSVYKDWIAFVPRDDKIRLIKAAFPELTTGTLPATAFATGGTPISSAVRIIYDQATGTIWYDADGSGPTQSRRFAILILGVPLTNTHFEIVDR